MKLTEEQKEIALRLMMEMREEEDTGGSYEDFVLEIFSRFLAALPKPEPVAWATTNEDGDYAMLFFDQQEARSYSGDDEPIGLAPVSASALLPEQENYKAQRDALLEELEKAAVAFWKLDNADIHAQEAESAIASVKGGE